MGLFGRTKLVDEETRHESPNGTETRKDPTFLGIPLLGTSGGPETPAEAERQESTSPEKFEEIKERPSAQTNPSTYSTIMTTESGKSKPGFQSTRFIDMTANKRNSK
jgi:hypothetical protein